MRDPVECAAPDCHETFMSRRSIQKYCSLKCKRRTGEKNRSRGGGTRVSPRIEVCQNKSCGETFEVWYRGGTPRKYCSDDCRYAARASRKGVPIALSEVCQYKPCGKAFKSGRSRGEPRNYCSDECRKAAKNYRRRISFDMFDTPDEEDGKVRKPAHLRAMPDSMEPLILAVLDKPGCSARYYAGRLGWTVPAVRTGLQCISAHEANSAP